MKKHIKKISILLALTMLLALPTSIAQASSCPPHKYYHNGTFQVPVSRPSHTVTVREYDPLTGGYKNVSKECKVSEVRTVYEYRCLCGAYMTEDYHAYYTHSINHPF